MVFVNANNRPGKRDGDEFLRQARTFKETWKISPSRVRVLSKPLDKAARRSYVYSSVLEAASLSYRPSEIAFFCHGTKNSLQGFGFLKRHVEPFALAMAALNPRADIHFYCCSMGKIGGFAQALSGELPNARILAHETSGHTTRNPHKVVWICGKRYKVKERKLWGPDEWPFMDKILEATL